MIAPISLKFDSVVKPYIIKYRKVWTVLGWRSVAECIKPSTTQNFVIPLLAGLLFRFLYSYSQGRLGCMMSCANQDLNSVVSTRKVSLNKLIDPPEMQQVVGNWREPGSRCNCRMLIDGLACVLTLGRERDSRRCACAKA